MRYRSGSGSGSSVLTAEERQQSQGQHKKKRKHTTSHPSPLPAESANSNSVSRYSHGFEVVNSGSTTTQLHATSTTLGTDQIPAKTEQTKATVVGGGGGEGFGFPELNGRDDAAVAVDDSYGKVVDSVEVESRVARSDTRESMELNRVLAQDSTLDKSPLTCFLDELYNGNSLRSTTTLGSENGRQRVYDTIFRLPWRCELLIDVGFFVCFNSFLSLLTVVPTRMVITIWRLLRTRKFKRPSTAELSDFGCFLIMVCGVTLLQQIGTDISLIYHMIRGQSTIKLYVIYNVLEQMDLQDVTRKWKVWDSGFGDSLLTKS